MENEYMSTTPPTSPGLAPISGEWTMAGEIHPDGFEIVFLLKRGSSYLMAVSWSAAEGNSLSLLGAEDSREFKEIVQDSWYRSPL